MIKWNSNKLELLNERSFVNVLSDEPNPSLSSDGKIPPAFQSNLKECSSQMTSSIEEACSQGKVDKKDPSVYTGFTGLALLYLKWYDLTEDSDFLVKAKHVLKPHLRKLRLRTKDCTFLCGDAGPLAAAAVVCHKLGESTESATYIESLLSFCKNVVLDKSLPDELLYGRVGYLYALLFVQEHLGKEAVTDGAVLSVTDAIVDSGRQFSASQQCAIPLAYSWHGQFYLGAAHGMVGIFYILLKLQQKYKTLNYSRFLKPSIEYLIGLKFPSGNYPSSLKSFSFDSMVPEDKDRLVHWCHGAPGWIYMFIEAYKLFKEERYLHYALGCGDVVWSRGLLTKGYGLCHGVSGNAYAFLALYKVTGEIRHLSRACQFATWCMDFGKHNCRTADRPFSLFEGVAGPAYFLIDLINPTKAKFPAFEL